MTIGEIVRQGLYYARTCRSLWLFGFFVGIAGGSSPVTYTVRSGAGGDGDAGGAAARGAHLDLSANEIWLVAIVIVLTVTALIIMRFVGEGALIEGVVRARQGGTMTVREGFRSGWAHWGVLVRIGLLYLAATIVSVGLLAAPCVVAWQALGPLGGVLTGIPTLLIGVPWLVTLYVVQAFAWPIAVLENRHALDAIGKARLFLHGRLSHGLKLIVATLVGTLGIVLPGVVAMAPVVLVLAALMPVLRGVPTIVLACLVLLPAICVLAAMVGTFRSSIWTMAYLTQVQS